MVVKSDRHAKKLVSILTPAYNSDKFIHRLLDSVVSQTYPYIEMIVVDDGSTDRSAEVIKTYMPKFQERGYSLQYVYQQNQGQSGAVNNGLKLVKGDYLVWPDADDFYSENYSIEKMAEALNVTDDSVGAVRVQYRVLDDALNVTGYYEVDDVTRYKTDLFEDYALTTKKPTWVIPGGYMIKMSIFDGLVPDREIYTEKEAGQNYQLMLPVLYSSKCLTIHEHLFSVVRHASSHSRAPYKGVLRRQVYRRAVVNTLNRLPMDKDYRKYIIKRFDERKPPMKMPVPKGRAFLRKAIKAITPYGLIVIYKRRGLK